MIKKIEIDQDGFKGNVEIDIPKFIERTVLMKSVITDGNELVDQIKQAEGLVGICKERVKSIELEFGKNKFTSLDDLEMYNEGMKIIYHLGGLIINGLPLGNA